MSSENPDAIRADIEATRARLGTNVDAVADKVTPSNIVHRQTTKVKDAVFGVKEKVMGAADHATHSTSGSVHHAAHSTSGGIHQATDAAGNAISTAGETISDAPQKVAAKTQGNPLAAGLIAFGAGLLVSSLIPPSQKEREAAEALKNAAEPVTTQLTEAAKDMGQDLKDQAQEAMENVKATATDAAAHVKDEGQTAVTDVKTSTSDAKDHVQNT
jgi:gas vesicle protein